MDSKADRSVVSLRRFSTNRFSVDLTDYNDGLRQGWHKHNDFVLAMSLRGYLREQVNREDRLIGPFAIGVKAPETRHTDHFGIEGVRAVRISFAPEFFSELQTNKLIKESWTWLLDSPAKRPFIRIIDTLLYDELNGSDLTEYVFEVIAGIDPDERSISEAQVPNWLKIAREDLHDTFTDGVRLTQLANYAGVHPVYFARQFRKFFGCSVGRYVRQLQFRAATELLAHAGNPLIDIAHQIGFSDQSHLSRVFLNEFGVSPGRFRKLCE